MDDMASISQHLLQFSPDALIVVDGLGIIQVANESTITLFGYPRKQLIGKSIDLLIPERFRIRHGAHLAGYVQDPSNREMGAQISDLFARRADGSEFPAGIRLAPFRDGDKRLVAAAIRDMTERRAISDALVLAREEADRANRAKSRFLATASHDLRQPLQTIRLLNASMLKSSEEASNLSDLLHRQEVAIDLATRLLNGLLDISRLESGAIEPQLSPVSLAEVFSDLAGEFESAAASNDLRLEFCETEIVLSTDRTLFAQILQNIVGNALKYTKWGFVRISQAIDSDALILEIEDSGVGIPEGKLERIFDEYYQVNTKGTQRLGVGLGLAIVREVSRLLGYSISVSSKLDEGTRVRVRVPVENILSEQHVPTRATKPVGTAQSFAKCRIVLLEDNDSVRAATELFLTLEGHETWAAANAAEAQSMLAALQPGDVFITDYHLDGQLTGLEVLSQLRLQKERDVPAILLSGDLHSIMRTVKTPMACCRFLSKPVNTKVLLETIAELSRSCNTLPPLQ